MAEIRPTADALSIHLPGPVDTDALGRRLAAALVAGDVVALTGDLGAGKTALARALIRALPRPDGSDADAAEVPSPTFTLVQSYDRRLADGTAATLWHFDLYRLGDPDEVDELGWEDALAEGAILIEWPDRLGRRLPAARLDVTLGFDDAGTGRLAVLQSAAGAWSARLDRLAP
jgi:tRNA threonylcarbamoyladenosine biosynthesis protein TsaE